MTSSQLPEKMTSPLGGKPVLSVLIDMLKHVPELNRIFLPTNAADSVLADATPVKGIQVLRSSEDDVLGRVAPRRRYSRRRCLRGYHRRLPAHRPCSMIREFFQTRTTSSYVANNTDPVCCAPRGFDIQIFDADALRTTGREASDSKAREYCVPFYCDGLAPRDALFDAQSVIEACLARSRAVKVCLALRGSE